MKTTHTIIHGDSRQMTKLADGSVDLVITSPPYWQLKDYGSRGEIGFDDSYEEYINHLNLVWQEAHRVLDKGCRLCINIGDQYARAAYYGRYKVIPIRTEIIKFCEASGFDYMGAIIWQKVATTNTSGGATIMGSFPYPRNGILKLDYEFILVFKKQGESSKKISKEIKQQSRLSIEEWNTYFAGHWNFVGEKQNKHLAMFPLELPYRLIKMFSFVGETVLDPFLGSGTTSLAALQLKRHSVGYEINRGFLPMIKEKLESYQPSIDDKPTARRAMKSFDQTFSKVWPPAGPPVFRFEAQTLGKIDFNSMIQQLPYVFNDPMKLEKLIDPRQRSFGSKVHKKSAEREEYYTVKQIISPTLLVLKDEIKIRLMGIEEDEEKREKALEFLKNKLKGRVFLRYDSVRHDAENRLWCYLYLKNKTFINAHLLKQKLVRVDESCDFKYKQKFLNLLAAAEGDEGWSQN